MQELDVAIRYQKSTKLLPCYQNLDQLLVRPLHATIMLALF